MELKVGDVMTRGAIYVRPKDNIRHIAEIMHKNDIDSIIVIDKRIGVGMITDNDIIVKVVSEGKDPNKVTAAEVMTSPLLTITPKEDIDEAAKKMRDKNIRRLVVKQGDNIIGVLSEFDLVKIEPAMHLLISEHAKLEASKRSEIHGMASGMCEECGNYTEDIQFVSGKQMCDDCLKE